MTRAQNAFTLIELIVSIAIGMLILSVALAGVRVAAQTISAANRLSLSNSIFRTAVVAANYEMDFWDTFDSRCDSTKQPLRENGFPFQPLDFSTPNTTLAFDHSGPREWYNGHIWSSYNNENSGYYMNKLGDYSIFGKQGMVNDGIVPSEREWRHRILPHITDNLGYYAALDYLPANFIYAFYDFDGTIPKEFGEYGAGFGHFNTNHRERHQPKSKPEMGHSSGFVLTTVKNGKGTHPQCHHGVYSSRGKNGFSRENMWQWDLYPQVDFLNAKPETWPQVTIRTCVYYYFNRFRHASRVVILDPMTGEQFSINIDGLTTTLRGARRQRELDTEITDPRYQ